MSHVQKNIAVFREHVSNKLVRNTFAVIAHEKIIEVITTNKYIPFENLITHILFAMCSHNISAYSDIRMKKTHSKRVIRK